MPKFNIKGNCMRYLFTQASTISNYFFLFCSFSFALCLCLVLVAEVLLILIQPLANILIKSPPAYRRIPAQAAIRR